MRRGRRARRRRQSGRGARRTCSRHRRQAEYLGVQVVCDRCVAARNDLGAIAAVGPDVQRQAAQPRQRLLAAILDDGHYVLPSGGFQPCDCTLKNLALQPATESGHAGDAFPRSHTTQSQDDLTHRGSPSAAPNLAAFPRLDHQRAASISLQRPRSALSSCRWARGAWRFEDCAVSGRDALCSCSYWMICTNSPLSLQGLRSIG